MKLKMMVVVAAMSFAAVASAGTNYVRWAVKCRDLTQVVTQMAKDPDLRDPAALRAAYAALDEACCTNPPTAFIRALPRCLPKTVEARYAASRWYTANVVTALVARCGYDKGRGAAYLRPREPQYVNMTLQGMCAGFRPAEPAKRGILTECVRHARRKVRSEGGSFAGREGAARVKAKLDALADALNAPRLGNAGELLADLGIPVDWAHLQSAMMTDEAAEKTVADALGGERPLDPVTQRRLCAVLGVARYNAFVREYNGL